MDHLKAHFGACEIYMSSCHYTRLVEVQLQLPHSPFYRRGSREKRVHALFANMRIFEGLKEESLLITKTDYSEWCSRV
jgi:hypothetical protein